MKPQLHLRLSAAPVSPHFGHWRELVSPDSVGWNPGECGISGEALSGACLGTDVVVSDPLLAEDRNSPVNGWKWLFFKTLVAPRSNNIAFGGPKCCQ